MEKKESWEDNMQYVADHMYYAIEYLEAIKKDYPKTAEKFEEESYDLDYLISEFRAIMNDFNYYAFHCPVDDKEKYEDDED